MCLKIQRKEQQNQALNGIWFESESENLETCESKSEQVDDKITSERRERETQMKKRQSNIFGMHNFLIHERFPWFVSHSSLYCHFPFLFIWNFLLRRISFRINQRFRMSHMKFDTLRTQSAHMWTKCCEKKLVRRKRISMALSIDKKCTNRRAPKHQKFLWRWKSSHSFAKRAA